MLNIDDRLIKEVSPKIGPNALSVLLAIAIHMNGTTSQCFPSNERLTELTGIGRDGIYAALAKLKEHGLLKTEQLKDNGVFSKRILSITTGFIGIFVPANQAAPFTAQPDTGSPFTENPAHNLLIKKEVINKKELLSKNDPDFSVEVYSMEKETLTLKEEKKEKPPKVAPTPPASDHGEIAKHLTVREQVFFAEIIRNKVWPEWVEYKLLQFKFKYKTVLTASKAIRELYEMANGNSDTAKKIADRTMGRGWQGFVALPEVRQVKPETKTLYTPPSKTFAG